MNKMLSRLTLLGLSFALFALGACDRNPPIDEVGSFRFEMIPVVGGQDFIGGFRYVNPEGRKYEIDFLRLYISDLTLVREDGTEKLLSEVNLYDLVEGGPARRVQHGNSGYAIFDEVEIGSYKGIKFGIGLPDRLNQDPATYGPEHPLSIGNQMYWSWRAGYKFFSIEGVVDSTEGMAGILLDHPLVYHTGKDSVGSPNPIYQEVTFLEDEHAFDIVTGQELHFEIDLDINKLFFGAQDTIDMVTENVSHSVPGEQFNLSVRLTNNLVNDALYKRPF